MPFMTRRIIAGASAVANSEYLEKSPCRFVTTSRPLKDSQRKMRES